MPRLEEIPINSMNSHQKEVREKITNGPRGSVPGPLAIWLYRSKFADLAQSLGQYCRFDSCLPPLLSELAILVTAKAWDSAYEWQAHARIAREEGLDPAIIDAIATGHPPPLATPDQEAVYEFSRTLHTDRRVPDDLYSRAEQVLGAEALVDLVGVLGYYTLISMTINAFEIPADPD